MALCKARICHLVSRHTIPYSLGSFSEQISLLVRVLRLYAIVAGEGDGMININAYLTGIPLFFVAIGYIVAVKCAWVPNQTKTIFLSLLI